MRCLNLILLTILFSSSISTNVAETDSDKSSLHAFQEHKETLKTRFKSLLEKYTERSHNTRIIEHDNGSVKIIEEDGNIRFSTGVKKLNSAQKDDANEGLYTNDSEKSSSEKTHISSSDDENYDYDEIEDNGYDKNDGIEIEDDDDSDIFSEEELQFEGSEESTEIPLQNVKGEIVSNDFASSRMTDIADTDFSSDGNLDGRSTIDSKSEYPRDELDVSLNKMRSVLGDILGQKKGDMLLEIVRLTKNNPELATRILHKSIPDFEKYQRHFKLVATALKDEKLLKYILNTAPLHMIGIDNKSPEFVKRINKLVQALKENPIVVETLINALENEDQFSEKKGGSQYLDNTISSKQDMKNSQDNANVLQIASLFLKHNVKNAFKHFIVQKIISNITNEQCRKQMTMFTDDLFSPQTKGWALQMLTASATPKTTPLVRIASMGNYDECLDIESEPDENEKRVRGKYCTLYNSIVNETDLLNILPYNASTLRQIMEARDGISPFNVLAKTRSVFGVCVPAACDERSLQFIPDIIQTAINTLIEHYSNHGVRINVHLKEGMCQSADDEVEYKSYNHIFVLICGFLIFILFLSTFLELISSKLGMKCSFDVLSCFSLHSNMRKVFALTVDERNINCLDGIRVLSMIWIVICHSYVIEFLYPIVNERKSLEIFNEYMSTFLMTGAFAVDTFLTLSGFLLVFIYFNRMDQGQETPVFVLYYKRFFRLVPTLAFIILFEMNKQLFFEGPMTKWYTREAESACIQDWWKILTFINNYKAPFTLCNLQSWYLAADTQLHILSPILLYGLMKNSKITIVLSTVAILAGAVGVSVVTFLWKPYPLLVGGDKTYMLYYHTEYRFSPWLMGGVFGYLMHKYKNKEKKQVSKTIQYFIWIFIFSTMIGVFLQLHHRLKMSRSGEIEKSVANGFYRQLWSLAICALIYLCSNEKGGVINKFLSLTIFRPISKLNYCTFLDHVIVKMYFTTKLRHERYFSTFEVLSRTTMELVATFVLSTVLAVAVEFPFANLGDVLLKKFSSLPTPKSTSKEKPNSSCAGIKNNIKNGKN